MAFCLAVPQSVSAAALYPTAVEQYVVELINRDRANPTAAAIRYGIDLNEGLAAGTISTAPKQPLAISPILVETGRSHSDWMQQNSVFAHNEGAITPFNRMATAGYGSPGTFGAAENIAFVGGGGFDVAAIASDMNTDLFVDTDISGRGHRLNLMNGSLKEIGAGIATGPFTYQGVTYQSVLLTEDFGYKFDNAFLTGVAYGDANADHFYSVGEGLAAATILATRISDNAQFLTSTWASGGYSLQLPVGTYSVVGFGGGLAGTVLFNTLAISSENVKRDFLPLNALSPGDATGDSKATGADYTIWAANFQKPGIQHGATGDFNGDGNVTGADYTIWAANFSAGSAAAPHIVPEPASWLSLAIGLGVLVCRWIIRTH